MNLAALCYLSMAGVMSGNDSLMYPPAAEARDMAERMNLISIRPSDESVMAFHQLSPEKIRQLANAAWGAYVWLT